MTKYIITISYDGSKYYGLQKLSNKKTVQGELESILSKMNEEPVKLYSSGRTDRGVHALGQVCMFELKKQTTPYKLRYYLNRMSSPHLFVKSCDVLNNEDFHPRFSTKTKTYKYVINVGEYDAIQNDYVYNYNRKLDVDAIVEASHSFLGSHNYRAFVVGKHHTCESTIENIEIEEDGDKITVRITGKAFYTYMVRNIISSLILVGAGELKSSDIDGMLREGKKTVEYPTAPPSGLYLEKINY